MSDGSLSDGQEPPVANGRHFSDETILGTPRHQDLFRVDRNQEKRALQTDEPPQNNGCDTSAIEEHLRSSWLGHNTFRTGQKCSHVFTALVTRTVVLHLQRAAFF
jgi:hypothetical protein